MALGAPGMGSVSRFAVSHSPVPVIVVRYVTLPDSQMIAYLTPLLICPLLSVPHDPRRMSLPCRPERKVKKTLQKRQADPKRGQYAQLVGPNGMELSRSRSRERSIGGLSD
jgi:hypothetical protein